MTSYAGWYYGRTEVGSVVGAKTSGPEYLDTVFQWPGRSGQPATVKPTAQNAGITGLQAVLGGPYKTQALAASAAKGSGTGTTAAPGDGVQTGVSDAKAGSDKGSLPSIPGVSSALGDIASIWSTLTTQNLWIRIAKVIGGGVLMLVGAVKLTGASGTLGKVTKIAPLL